MKLNNKQKISNINNSIDNIYRQLAVLTEQLAELTADIVEEECCNIRFDSKIDYDKHRESNRCKIKRKVPYFKCNRCNNPFFDGYNTLEELNANPLDLLKSSYRKHCNDCKSSCDRCGIFINTFYMKKNHICADIREENKTTKKEKKPKFKVKLAEPPPEYSSEDEEIAYVKEKTEMFYTEASESESENKDLSHVVEETFNNVRYMRNTKTNKLYDWESNPVGYWIPDECRPEFDSDVSSSEDEEEEPKKIKFKIKKII